MAQQRPGTRKIGGSPYRQTRPPTLRLIRETLIP